MIPTSLRTGRLCASIVGLLAVYAQVHAGVPVKARDGARLYADSAFTEAADAFRQATIAAPGDPRWRYDLGLSEAQGEDYENALNNLTTTARMADSGVAGNAWFNAGNVHYAMGNFAGAAEAYRSALLIHPDDADAKRNLELALMQLAQQQSQSQEESPQENQEEQGGEEDQDSQEQDQQEDQKQQDDASGEQDQDSTSTDPSQDPPEDQQAQSDSTLTREQAERILRALADEEARLRNQARNLQLLPAPGGKDW
jgi:tetratricopeptide (TPR) repeat protein